MPVVNGVDALTLNKTFLAEICKIMWKFADLPCLTLSDTLDFGQIRGRNGQIHVVSKESYEAWLVAKAPELKPPKIRLDLKEAQWINDELAICPNQSALARKRGIDRTSLIRTRNLIRLDPAIKEYIMQLEPDTRECPLTKKRLRFVATIAEPEVQKERFKKLIDLLRDQESKYIELPPFD